MIYLSTQNRFDQDFPHDKYIWRLFRNYCPLLIGNVFYRNVIVIYVTLIENNIENKQNMMETLHL